MVFRDEEENDGAPWCVTDADEWSWGDATTSREGRRLLEFSEATRESVDVKALPRSAFVLVLLRAKPPRPVWLPVREASGKVNIKLLRDAAQVRL